MLTRMQFLELRVEIKRSRQVKWHEKLSENLYFTLLEVTLAFKKTCSGLKWILFQKVSSRSGKISKKVEKMDI